MLLNLLLCVFFTHGMSQARRVWRGVALGFWDARKTRGQRPDGFCVHVCDPTISYIYVNANHLCPRWVPGQS